MVYSVASITSVIYTQSRPSVALMYMMRAKREEKIAQSAKRWITSGQSAVKQFPFHEKKRKRQRGGNPTLLSTLCDWCRLSRIYFLFSVVCYIMCQPKIFLVLILSTCDTTTILQLPAVSRACRRVNFSHRVNFHGVNLSRFVDFSRRVNF